MKNNNDNSCKTSILSIIALILLIISIILFIYQCFLCFLYKQTGLIYGMIALLIDMVSMLFGIRGDIIKPNRKSKIIAIITTLPFFICLGILAIETISCIDSTIDEVSDSITYGCD